MSQPAVVPSSTDVQKDDQEPITQGNARSAEATTYLIRDTLDFEVIAEPGYYKHDNMAQVVIYLLAHRLHRDHHSTQIVQHALVWCHYNGFQDMPRARVHLALPRLLLHR